MNTRFCIMLISLVFIGRIASAQEGPSLDATIKYLASKINYLDAYVCESQTVSGSAMNSSATTTVSYEVTGFSEGTLSIVETRKTESTISSDYGGVTTGTGTIRNIIHIPLSVLSAQVKVVPADQPVNRSMGSVTGTDTFNGYKVEIVASDPSTAGIPTDEYRSTDSTGEGKPDRSVVAKWDFPVADEGVANQIAKALKHAIELSGGKKDLFDSSTPP